ncbi:hypothetical protein V7S43_010640 [Phytophthora oleae]|uniref:Uncharacterized protein n=1 Tax=Phytophthora oleae TaxID=2107226 RepID=A0ABD3FFL7_9STRA
MEKFRSRLTRAGTPLIAVPLKQGLRTRFAPLQATGVSRYGSQAQEYPDEWDFVEETQDPDDIPPPFETAAETSESEIDSGTAALSQLAPEDLYRLKQTTTNTHFSVICKLTRICRVLELIKEIKRICVVMK